MRTPNHSRKYRRYQPCNVDFGLATSRFRWSCVAFLLFVMVTALAFVWCRSSRDRTGRTVQRLRRQFSLKAKEAENLRMELEKYRGGSYILREVNRLGLGLRPADPQQVRRLEFRPPLSPDEWRTDRVVAQN